LPVYLLIAAVLVLLLAVKLAKFIGILVVLALLVIVISLNKRRWKL
jgi:hypothetical protein